MSFFRLPHVVTAAALLSAASLACALSLSDLSSKDATSGVKTALEKGATVAVAKLGVQDGFLNNDKVRIGLPGPVEKAKPILKMLGQSKRVEELEVSMNHAAESAVAEAKPLLLDAVKNMSVTDAKNILTGGETSVTEFFRGKTSASLTTKFLPIVKKITDGNGLSAQYNTLMSKANASGLTKENATVEDYVTQRALDGLYTIIADEEKAIRADPVGTGSAILGKVFGAVK
ncbi:hypothetical protein GCM10007205_07790 [Oxalicibacterium flavum]|uniref:DUF4197 domain-containing protein n=1 Tax=Oxalicibacterium flavum TaxID=179467 RepID=A0A8J2UMY8_9BURK|nr:DUF4197 domain-containing protein [Oxalicibacterium flavum]GGC00987.1 hypothetical protein GCM10007205_07790 [Oxalicibacterium flavum]